MLSCVSKKLKEETYRASDALSVLRQLNEGLLGRGVVVDPAVGVASAFLGRQCRDQVLLLVQQLQFESTYNETMPRN